MARRIGLLAALAILATPLAASAQPAVLDAAQTVKRIPAPEARQGVAVDGRHVYAVANWVIAKYDKKTGEKLAQWTGDKARFPHINSCAVIRKELVCASSNFPATPQWSAVEVFEPATLAHKRTIPLGLGIGSITWVDWKDGAWWALFANYDAKGGEAPRDHRHTTLVRFDAQWRRTGGWAFPASVLERFAPMSSSGGGFGPDGRLYVTGHDHPELYVLQLPKDGGPVLEHVATIPVEVEGQAIDWDESDPGVLYGISRPRGEIVGMRIPAVK